MNKLEEINKRRAYALQNKIQTFSGSCCAKCGTTKRYTSNKRCYTCAKLKSRERAKQTMAEKEMGRMAFISEHKGKAQYSKWI